MRKTKKPEHEMSSGTNPDKKQPKNELEKVCKAPDWLVARMEALKKMPPPTLEEVHQQMEASRKWQEEYGFGCVEKIKKAKYLR